MTKFSAYGKISINISVIFLKEDLVFAKYDDGEMFGGDFFIEAIFSDERLTNLKTLWTITKTTEQPAEAEPSSLRELRRGRP